jgi:hypothetical protein
MGGTSHCCDVRYSWHIDGCIDDHTTGDSVFGVDRSEGCPMGDISRILSSPYLLTVSLRLLVL